PSLSGRLRARGGGRPPADQGTARSDSGSRARRGRRGLTRGGRPDPGLGPRRLAGPARGAAGEAAVAARGAALDLERGRGALRPRLLRRAARTGPRAGPRADRPRSRGRRRVRRRGIVALRVERDGEVLRITLERPEARNAFDAALIVELAEAFVD